MNITFQINNHELIFLGFNYTIKAYLCSSNLLHLRGYLYRRR